MKIGIGTAQFGMDYGISNAAGKVSRTEAREILRAAPDLGVSVLDTAPGYGESEKVLGEILPTAQNYQIVTKTPAFKCAEVTRDHVRLLGQSLDQSLARLRQKSVYGLLMHHADDLFVPGGERLADQLQEFVTDGRVSKVGVSIYTAEQIDRVLSIFVPDIVQLPLSVLDQRLVQSGHLAKLHHHGSEIHARSIFLQGLLLMKPTELPAYFDPVRSHLSRYCEFLTAHGLSAVEAAVGFVETVKDVDTMILGVCTAQQLRDICAVVQRRGQALPDLSDFALADPDFINPAQWQQNAC